MIDRAVFRRPPRLSSSSSDAQVSSGSARRLEAACSHGLQRRGGLVHTVEGKQGWG
jgi:hypothetical protein